jgi:hypothetical protein
MASEQKPPDAAAIQETLKAARLIPDSLREGAFDGEDSAPSGIAGTAESVTTFPGITDEQDDARANGKPDWLASRLEQIAKDEKSPTGTDRGLGRLLRRHPRDGES